MSKPSANLLDAQPDVLQKLCIPAAAWSGQTEALLDQIPIQPGWRCLDVARRPGGILPELSRRISSPGRITGATPGDVCDSKLPSDFFDLVHARFLLAPLGDAESTLLNLLDLLRPGGILVLQEPDSASWCCQPCSAAFDRLTSAVVTAFELAGGCFDAGRGMFQMLRAVGLNDVKLRVACVALQDRHPDMRHPVEFASALRDQIVGNDLMTADELDQTIAEVEQHLARPDTTVTSFILMQAWGRKG